MTEYWDVRLECPYCENRERFQLSPLRLYSTRSSGSRGLIKVADVNNAQSCAFGTTCDQCNRPFGVIIDCSPSSTSIQPFITAKGQREKIDSILQSAQVRIYPNKTKITISEFLPEEIRQSFIDICEDAARRRNAAGIMSVARGCLDVSLKLLGETTGGRSQRIQNLAKNGTITHGLAEWSNKLWKDGSDAVHDLRAEIDNAIEYVEFLTLFFEVVFALPKKIEAAKHSDIEES